MYVYLITLQPGITIQAGGLGMMCVTEKQFKHQSKYNQLITQSKNKSL